MNGSISERLEADRLYEEPPFASKETTYVFPMHRLKAKMDDPSKAPAVFVFCGSFSPITSQHLRVFELAADHAKHRTEFEIVGGYISPVSDAYLKSGLASSKHRLVNSPT